MAWRCDAFYRCLYDITDPAPIRETQAVHDRPTRGGTHSKTPDDAKYYNIFGLDSWDCLMFGGHAAIASSGCESLAAWNLCPKLEPSVPL